jgi:two-component system sensor kinase FixL
MRITLITTGEDAQVAVRDWGPGIADDQRGKVFDSFWTTKSQGMGIGLPISRSIIESHGGRLWWENHAERGATFYFTLSISIQRDLA